MTTQEYFITLTIDFVREGGEVGNIVFVCTLGIGEEEQKGKLERKLFLGVVEVCLFRPKAEMICC